VRHGITILPQNPMLFKGTVRQNIDPFNHYQDNDIWDTLEVVQLKSLISAMPLKLESEVEEGNPPFPPFSPSLPLPLSFSPYSLQRETISVKDKSN
jgi:hypothetical protein